MKSNDCQVEGLLQFLDASPSPFHAVEQCRKLLEDRGFQRLTENDSWKSSLQPGKQYYFSRNGSSLVAFAIGGQFSVSKGAFKIVAAHTDSPCLRVKPLSGRSPKEGFSQVAVEAYGGGLWHTWFDRDLGVAGRIVTGIKNSVDGNVKIQENLVNIARPILRIPTLAIHLDGSVRESFKFNTETHLCPILATTHYRQDGQKAADNGSINKGSIQIDASLRAELLAAAGLEESKAQILSSDLCLYDTQVATRGGINGEFIQSARLDNLFMSYCSLQSMIAACESVSSDTDIRVLSLFDNEEVGSLSAAGAESTLLLATAQRILASLLNSTDDVASLLPAICARSFLISADMAHAAHPNYPEKHDELHRPQMHKGLVIKYNSNQRYATNARTAARIKSLANQQAIPVQDFMVRNDSPCGTTIGPIVSAQLGIPAVDVGAPQLSMHSIREMAGCQDIIHSIGLLKAFYDAPLLDPHNPDF